MLSSINVLWLLAVISMDLSVMCLAAFFLSSIWSNLPSFISRSWVGCGKAGYSLTNGVALTPSLSQIFLCYWQSTLPILKTPFMSVANFSKSATISFDFPSKLKSWQKLKKLTIWIIVMDDWSSLISIFGHLLLKVEVTVDNNVTPGMIIELLRWNEPEEGTQCHYFIKHFINVNLTCQ